MDLFGNVDEWGSENQRTRGIARSIRGPHVAAELEGLVERRVAPGPLHRGQALRHLLPQRAAPILRLQHSLNRHGGKVSPEAI